MQQLGIELYRVLPLPEGVSPTLRELRVVSATMNGEPVATKEPQVLVEQTRNGEFLHVRVPLGVPWFPPGLWPMKISQHGMTVELEGELGE